MATEHMRRSSREYAMALLEGTGTYSLTLPDPDSSRWYGPGTAMRIKRTAVIFGSLWAVGAILMFAGGSDHGYRVLGLGLFAPGAGFLAWSGWLGPVIFVAVFAWFLLSVVLWYATGNLILPLLTWILATLAASTWSADAGPSWAMYAVPAAVLIWVAQGVLRSRARFSEARQFAHHLNETVLATSEPIVRFDQPYTAGVEEMSAEDLAHLRLLVDAGLEYPTESLTRLDRVEEFQPAGIRYQLTVAQAALAVSQFARTPAFQGYATRAQRGLIDKMTVKQVWRYWRYENMWGNGRISADPIARDNIMLSGYYNLNLGMFESASGDHRYDEPGSIVFRENDRKSFDYDHTSITRAVDWNFHNYGDLCWFPCEPNFIYEVCNYFALVGQRIYDQLHGTDYCADVLEPFRRAYFSEFTLPDGRNRGLPSSRFGFAVFAPKSGVNPAGPGIPFSWLQSAVMPDIAERNYILFREALGENRLKVPFDNVGFDIGNYADNRSGFHGTMAQSAAELGDTELRDAILDSAREKLAPTTVNGVYQFEDASMWINAQLCYARVARKGVMFDMANRGRPREYAEGPVLADAAFPQVLVARATTDGRALEFVLRPGAAAGRFELSIERLRPFASYAVSGAVEDTISADGAGAATISVDLAGRHEVTIRPVG